MARKKKGMATESDIDVILDQMGIEKGAAREKAKVYCTAKINLTEGQCLPTDELRIIMTAYFDGYSESLRGG
jgi:hypothetical protein